MGLQEPVKRETDEFVKFFKSLPEGRFTKEEEDLRDAILHYLDEWQQDRPPNLSDACKGGWKGLAKGKVSPINVARNRCMPKAVKLYQWVERRMGGEIELVRGVSSQIYFHRKGELNFEALPEQTNPI